MVIMDIFHLILMDYNADLPWRILFIFGTVMMSHECMLGDCKVEFGALPKYANLVQAFFM